MSRKLASSNQSWTDQEKFHVMFSMIDTSKGIDWSKVYIPEGRTQKAVMHMIAKEKSKWGIAPPNGGDKSASPGDDGDGLVQTPKPSKAARAAKTPKRDGQEKTNGKRKRNVKTQEDSNTPKDPHNDPGIKRVKQELADLADELREAAADNEA